LNFSEGETPIFVDRWIQWINGEVKVECLSTLASSGEVEAVRSESMRVVGLGTLNFDISEVESVEEVIFRESPIREVPT
jgi:hypothetical protein